MIKAVFFDLYQTLITYEPPREEVHAQMLREHGMNLEPYKLLRPITIADRFFYEEHARYPLSRRSPREIEDLYYNYQEILLKEAGVDAPPEIIRAISQRLQRVKFDTVCFPDVLPSLAILRGEGLYTGLISNVENIIDPMLEKLGLANMLDFIVTSKEAGANKPDKKIFDYALSMAGTPPEEAAFVGDQYSIDVLGAEAAGLKGILLDRNGYFDKLNGVTSIKSLYELTQIISGGES